VSTERDADGAVTALSSDRGWPQREVFIYAEIDRLPDTELPDLIGRLETALGDVRAAVSDFTVMKGKLAELTEGLRNEPPIVETITFAAAGDGTQVTARSHCPSIAARALAARDALGSR